MAPANTPLVDLIIVFRSSEPPVTKVSASATKQLVVENAQAAEAEYTRLLNTLREAELKATGRKGEKNGQVLVLVWAPWETLKGMVVRERQSDFLRGLPASSLPSLTSVLNPEDIAPADRLRLVYERITSTRHDGGLGIVPHGKGWERVESIMSLHDREFNEMWLRAWTRRQVGLGIGIAELDKIKDQFGEAVALYFSFLSSYTQSLVFISLLGALFYFLKLPYNAIYSALLVIWSTGFVEFWRLRERALAVRWGTLGSFRVERRRAQYEDSVAPGSGSLAIPWWKRDLRILASLPVILAFATALAMLLTGIFVFEAFVTKLYTGPGQKYVGFSPTVLFLSLVPRLLGLYQTYAVRLTSWENHAHQSTHDASLTIKTFALSAIVAYLGLALSAFVYVPFGDKVMEIVQGALSASSSTPGAKFAQYTNGTVTSEKANNLWANKKLTTNSTRLQDQMYAYTVTNQGIGAFLEVGLPFITRKIDAFRNGNKNASSDASSHGTNGGKKKRVVFEDEESGEKEEREFLARVRHEVALPEYTLFSDYSEMVTQFGYVALWSTIWPLAPVMSLVNNWLELRSDALKITSHCRRPIPMRTDTIGPWLDALGVITWLAALTNSALVYLFRPSSAPTTNSSFTGTTMPPPSEHHHTHPLMPAHSSPFSTTSTYTPLIAPALLIALSASHAYFIARRVVRHVLVRVLWKGGKEEAMEEEANLKVKQRYLKSLSVEGFVDDGNSKGKEKDVAPSTDLDELDATGFWTRDEGLDEITKVVKDA